MKKNSEPTYSIGDAEKFTGVSQRMLRAWEGRHIPLPDRIVCGERAYRRYTQSQVKLIKRIKEYQDQGYTLKMASEKARADLGMKGGALNA
jgi:DNA-binding transcriptional MerR regulator